MNKKRRTEKLAVLRAIRERRIKFSDLRPPQVYIFTESNLNSGIYEHNGKEYNETDFKEFCSKIQRNNKGSLIWNEGRQYPNEDIIIKISMIDEGQLPK